MPRVDASRLHPGATRAARFALVVTVALVVTRVLWPAPSGIVVNGAILGSLSALIAVGIALVYRANRAINFAQADLGVVPALLAVLLVNAWGWNWWIGAIAGLAAAILLGGLVEWLVIRRFFRAPRLILTVATIGIAQVLVGVSLFMPNWFGGLTNPRLSGPIDASMQVGGVRFSGDDLLAVIVVPVVLVGLALFLRFSPAGVAIRGSAESAERASLLGIPVQRLHTLVWVLAAVLAFTALFLRAGIVGSSIGRVMGPDLLLRALAAAVIGRMERLPTIVIAAVGLGIIDQSVKYAWDLDPYRDAVIALIVIVALLAVRARTGRSAEVSTWQAAREVRPIPFELRRLPEVRAVRVGLGVVVVGFLATLPLWMGVSRVNLAAVIAIFAIIGVSLVVLTGWAGQVSLGQMAFVGLGGAAAGTMTGRFGWDLALGLVVGGVVGSVTCVLVGLPTLRARGLAFAVATLALALVTSRFLLNPAFFGDGGNLWSWLPARRDLVERPDFLFTIPVGGETAYYFLTLGVLALAIASVRSLRRSRTGRVLIGARENERQAESYGVSARRAAVAAFAYSGFLAGVAGALFVHHQRALDLSHFSPEAGLQVFAMVVVGGLGSVGGAILGAVYVRGAQWFLPGAWSLLATGAGLLVVLMILPGGLGAALGDLRDGALRWVARRRGIRVPSLVADTRTGIEATSEMAEAVADATDGLADATDGLADATDGLADATADLADTTADLAGPAATPEPAPEPQPERSR